MILNDKKRLDGLEMLLTRMANDGHTADDIVAAMFAERLWLASEGDVRKDLEDLLEAELTPEEKTILESAK